MTDEKKRQEIKRIVNLISSLVWLLILIVGFPICLLGFINWIFKGGIL